MSRLAVLGAVIVAVGGLAACFYTPPGNLPSSTRVLYSKTTTDSVSTSTDIYFLVARSGNELRLTGEEGVDRSPAFADSTLAIYFARETAGRSEVWRMAFDGSDETRVLGETGVDFREPAVAPGGGRLAYVRDEGGRTTIVVSDLDGGNAETVVEGAGWRSPAWSPDGRRLALVREEGNVPRIYIVAATGGDPRPAAQNDPTPQDHPAWSPDGARIAFRSGRDTGAEIAVLTVDGGEVRRLTDNGAEDGEPAWSPSGERIVFVSRRPDNRYNLWTMGADGSNVEALTSSDSDEAHDPLWL